MTQALGSLLKCCRFKSGHPQHKVGVIRSLNAFCILNSHNHPMHLIVSALEKGCKQQKSWPMATQPLDVEGGLELCSPLHMSLSLCVVCTCLCITTCAGACAPGCSVHREARDQHHCGVLFHCSLPYFLEQSFLLNLRFNNPSIGLSSKSQGSSCLHFPSTGIIDNVSLSLAFIDAL